MSYDLHCVLYEFLHILPPKLFKLFSLITVSFANYSNFFVKARHQTWSAKGFEKFQIVTHEFLGCQFLEKYNFGQSLIHQKKKKKKKKFRLFCNNWICYFYTNFQMYFQNIYTFIWLKALSNKLCRFKNQKKFEIFAILAFLPFIVP